MSQCRLFMWFIAVTVLGACRAQDIPEHLQTPYSPLNDKLSTTVRVDEQSLGPAEVQKLNEPILLDARERAEFEISHLPGALHLGYDQPNYEVLEGLDRGRPVVVYCTIGYRSQRMVSRLEERGFSQVYNLYGSIYAWLLNDLPLVNSDGQPTKRVHTYNRKWGTYLPEDIEKVH